MTTTDLFNAIEVVLWCGIAIGVVVWALRRRHTDRSELFRLRLQAAVWFVLFAISDAIEFQTGAWWRPPWLAIWKGACIIALVLCFLRHRRLTNRSEL